MRRCDRREFAYKFFPDGQSLEHTITAGFGSGIGPCAIVGVVYTKNTGLNDAGPGSQYQAYYSLNQDPDQWVPVNYPDQASWFARF